MKTNILVAIVAGLVGAIFASFIPEVRNAIFPEANPPVMSKGLAAADPSIIPEWCIYVKLSQPHTQKAGPQIADYVILSTNYGFIDKPSANEIAAVLKKKFSLEFEGAHVAATGICGRPAKIPDEDPTKNDPIDQ